MTRIAVKNPDLHREISLIVVQVLLKTYSFIFRDVIEDIALRTEILSSLC